MSNNGRRLSLSSDKKEEPNDKLLVPVKKDFNRRGSVRK